MRFWARSIRNRFLLLFVTIGVLVGAAVSVGHLGVSRSVDDFRQVTEHELEHERAVSKMVVGFKKQVQEWKNVLLRGADPKQREKYWGKFEQEEQAIQQAGAALLSGMPASTLRDRVAEFLSSHQSMGEAYRKGYRAFVEAGFEAAAGDQAVKGIDRAPTQLLEEVAEAIEQKAGSAIDGAIVDASRTSLIAFAFTLGALLVGVVVSVLFLRRFVTRPVAGVVAVLDRLARCDFRVEIEPKGEDELATLATSARQIRDNLGQLLGRIAGMAVELDHASAQLAEYGERNRVQLGRQRDGTAQVATATEELAATAKEVAGSASSAATAADQVAASTRNGMQVVEQAIASINHLESDVARVGEVLDALETHSGAIGNVLNVIRGIAEQTNLLALNAAIEAARAGEQGRGFAVVADEVRSLAQRTQESTQEIQLTIEQLQEGARAAVTAMEHGRERVGEGVLRTREIGGALSEISAAVATIVDMNAHIATAAEEQGVVAVDVSRSVSGIDQSSESLVDAAASLAETGSRIAALSGDLAQAASRFRT